MEKIERIIELVREGYILVTWPESQELMDEPWFEEEAIFVSGSEEKIGSSAYYVPIKRMTVVNVNRCSTCKYELPNHDSLCPENPINFDCANR